MRNILLYPACTVLYVLMACGIQACKNGSENPPSPASPKVAEVTTIAGSTQGWVNGPSLEAQFNLPYSLAFASDGSLYIADSGNSNIRKISADTREVSDLPQNNIPDGVGAQLQTFYSPRGITVGRDGTIYVADFDSGKIRKISSAGVVTTIAGGYNGYTEGTGLEAYFAGPAGIAVAPDGTAYVADEINNKIRKVTAGGVVTTFAGDDYTPGPYAKNGGFQDGMGKEAKFLHPTGIAIAADGTLYVTDKFNHKIRKITPDGMVTTLAGSDYGYLDGPGTRAQFKYPNGIAIAPDGTLYVADTDNNRIRRVSPTGEVTTVAGGEIGYKDGVGETAQFWSPHGIAVSPDGSVWVADTGNHKIRKITFK